MENGRRSKSHRLCRSIGKNSDLRHLSRAPPTQGRIDRSTPTGVVLSKTQPRRSDWINSLAPCRDGPDCRHNLNLATAEIAVFCGGRTTRSAIDWQERIRTCHELDKLAYRDALQLRSRVNSLCFCWLVSSVQGLHRQILTCPVVVSARITSASVSPSTSPSVFDRPNRDVAEPVSSCELNFVTWNAAAVPKLPSNAVPDARW